MLATTWKPADRRHGVVGPGGFPWLHRATHVHGVHIMKWETPQATDQRFGFEITMYIANR